MGVFEEQAKDKSDWTDQDLLLYDEAEERLVALEQQIREELSSLSDPERVAYLEQRLSTIEVLLGRYAAARQGGTS